MEKKLFRNCHWFSLAVCLSSLLFCANPIVAQNNMPEDVTVLNAKTETDRYKSVLNLSDGKYKDVYDITSVPLKLGRYYKSNKLDPFSPNRSLSF